MMTKDGWHEGRGCRVARVLIVDDDPGIREVVRMALEEEAGHRVEEAVDGAGAVARLLGDGPLVALLDLHLGGGLDGAGVLAAVEGDPDLARRHGLVLLTGTPRDRFPAGVAALVDRLGIPVLGKPFDLDDLLAAVAGAAARIGA